MIVDRRPRTGAAPFAAVASLPAAGLLTLFFLLTTLLQYFSGAQRAEFAGYPDESAHYVTGLMVREYLASGHYTSPMAFATAFEARYPKVALGHWPPLFYLFEGVWMLPFGGSRFSVLIALAAMTTLLAWLVYGTTRRHFGKAAGALAGLLLICVPLVQTYSAEIMAESLLTVTSFAAAIYFARYLETESWRDSLRFGLLASLAILTKGSGWDLALVPPVAVLLTRRWNLLRRGSFWMPAGVVAVLCGPWQVVTMALVNRGWQGGDRPSLSYTVKALWEFLMLYGSLLGWGMALLVLAGIAVQICVPYAKRAVKPWWATMFALLFAVWLFHSAVPAGVEPRKLMAALPAMIAFLFAGGDWLARRFRFNSLAVASVAVLVFAVETFTIPHEVHYGYREAAEWMHRREDLRAASILISSERDGEGMLISELAMRGQDRAWRILRATKTLARTDWNGKLLECLVGTPAELMAYLEREKVNVLVTDTLPPAISFEFQKIVIQTIAEFPRRFHLLGRFTGEAKGEIYIYGVGPR